MLLRASFLVLLLALWVSALPIQKADASAPEALFKKNMTGFAKDTLIQRYPLQLNQKARDYLVAEEKRIYLAKEGDVMRQLYDLLKPYMARTNSIEDPSKTGVMDFEVFVEKFNYWKENSNGTYADGGKYDIFWLIFTAIATRPY